MPRDLQPDFADESPIELMALADVERVHSALLAWVLGHASPLAPDARARVLAALTGSPMDGITEAIGEVERGRLDVRINVRSPSGDRAVAIEVKLKAEESDDQLARYEARLAPGTAKVFLTPGGDPPETGSGWHPVSYETYLAALRSEQPVSRPEFFSDYLALLSRIVVALRRVCAEPSFAAFVFDEADTSGEVALDCYVSRLRVAQLLQRAWLSELRRALLLLRPLAAGWNSTIQTGSRSASGLLDFYTVAAHPPFRVGLQVQGRTLKMFSHPSPYDGSLRNESAELLERMRAAGRIMGRVNRDRTKGFWSVSMAKVPSARRIADWAPLLRKALDDVERAVAVTARVPV